jgi:predicted nucleic acid-binding protein
VDTSAIYALLVADDEEHESSRAMLTFLDKTDVVLVTSSYVLRETTALLQSRIGIPAVRVLQEKVFPLLEIEWITRDLYERAVSALLAASKRQVSLTDWTSFEVMRKRGIEAVFAFDDHFEEQGFELVSRTK